MASGWAGDGAVQDQIDSTIDDAVARARSFRAKATNFVMNAERRFRRPGDRPSQGRYCVKCQQEKDLHNNTFSGYNRRGSKDSQLR